MMRYGENLDFQATVADVFSFLESEYKLDLHFPNEYVVAYSNRDFDVIFDIDPPLNSVGVNFKRSIYEITLGGILYFRSRENARFGGVHARSHEILLSFLQVMAGLMKEHAHDILTGDKKAFMALIDLSEPLNRDYSYRLQYGNIREKASLAWQQKEYGKAKELYESMEVALRPAEARRLEYLRRNTL